MTSRDSITRSGRGWKKNDLKRDILNEEIQRLDLRNALEFYGLKFNNKNAALCPFHSEKTASFIIKRGNKGEFWHCFGCGETGDLIQFARKLFGMSYTDAVDTIAKDFGINNKCPTPQDQERFDMVKIARYNSKRRYSELLNELDTYTEFYWLAYDLREHVARFYGGANTYNERYVNAQYALLQARAALEEAEAACSDYLRENPSATPMPPRPEPTTVKLPPAPKPVTRHNSVQKRGEMID